MTWSCTPSCVPVSTKNMGLIGRLEGAQAELSAASELYRAMEMIFWLHPVETALAQVEER